MKNANSEVLNTMLFVPNQLGTVLPVEQQIKLEWPYKQYKLSTLSQGRCSITYPDYEF